MITKENCISALNKFLEERKDNDSVNGQAAAAWAVVYDFCDENGMYEQLTPEETFGKAGLEIVITFLEKLLNSEQAVKECDTTMQNQG